MLVKCKSNLGKTLPKSIYKTNRRYYDIVNFGLTIDEVYVVFGIAVLEEGYSYFILPEDSPNPVFLPTDLFSVEDPRVPPNWYFEYYGRETPRNHDTVAIFGYKELVTDPTHTTDLFELEESAVEIFKERKKEIESFH